MYVTVFPAFCSGFFFLLFYKKYFVHETAQVTVMLCIESTHTHCTVEHYWCTYTYQGKRNREGDDGNIGTVRVHFPSATGDATGYTFPARQRLSPRQGACAIRALLFVWSCDMKRKWKQTLRSLWACKFVM